MKQSNVIFLEDKHEYWLGDLKLIGITGRLGKSIFFKDKFKGIPKHILENKAKYGSWVHKQFELHDTNQPYEDCWEVQEYEKMLKKYKIKPIQNEFLISDDAIYATMIDMIDEKLDFYDHKTSFTLDPEYLSWQLSINKYLFFKQTGLEAGNLFAVHVKNNEVKRVSIKEKTFEECYDMLYTDKYMPKDDEMPSVDDMPAIDVLDTDSVVLLTNLEDAIISLNEKLEAYKAERDRFLELARTNMELYNIEKWETDKLVVTMTKAYSKQTVDSKKLKEDMPDVYAKYSKETQVKSSVKIKIK